MPANYTARYHGLPVLAVFALAALASSPALAVDGVIEINQARALAGGVTPGDAPGFPVTISEGGSYRLTGNLDVRGQPDPEDVTAIEVDASGGLTTIDLNGFSIFGPTVCTGAPVTSCTPTGIGIGIGRTRGKLIVRNGMVRGMGGGGIMETNPSTSGADVVESVIAESNGSHGISTIVARNCQARQNWGRGIDTPGTGQVSGSTVSSNKEDGIFAIDRARITDNVVLFNGENGIQVGNDGVIRGNTVNENVEAGISAGDGSLVIDNVVRRNTLFGLDGNADTAYSGNALTGNNGGAEIQVNGGIEIGTNLCGTDTTCP